MAVVAVVVLVVTVPVVWQVAAVREDRATAAERRDALADVVADRNAPTDFDGDGVSDDRDQCPRRPETENGFQDDDGCPDLVATTGAS